MNIHLFARHHPICPLIVVLASLAVAGIGCGKAEAKSGGPVPTVVEHRTWTLEIRNALRDGNIPTLACFLDPEGSYSRRNLKAINQEECARFFHEHGIVVLFADLRRDDPDLQFEFRRHRRQRGLATDAVLDAGAPTATPTAAASGIPP